MFSHLSSVGDLAKSKHVNKVPDERDVLKTKRYVYLSVYGPEKYSATDSAQLWATLLHQTEADENPAEVSIRSAMKNLMMRQRT